MSPASSLRPDSQLVQDVIRTVADDFSVVARRLFRRGSTHRAGGAVLTARQVSQYILSVSLGYGQTAVAEVLGFDRNTIRYNSECVEDMRDDAAFDERLSRLEKKFEHGTVSA